MKRYSASSLIKKLIKTNDIDSNDIIFVSVLDAEVRSVGLELIKEINKAKLNAVLSPSTTNIRKHLKLALSLEIKWFLIIGTKEYEENQIVLRNLVDRSEIVIS